MKGRRSVPDCDPNANLALKKLLRKETTLPGEMIPEQQVLPEQEVGIRLLPEGFFVPLPIPRSHGRKFCSPFSSLSGGKHRHLCGSLQVFCSRKILKLCQKQFNLFDSEFL